MKKKQPTANSQQPTANSQQPTANSQQPTANSQQPTANQRDTITVYFNGHGMSVWKAVAEPLNLKNCQTLLNEEHFWEVLSANASFGISICEHEMAKNDN